MACDRHQRILLYGSVWRLDNQHSVTATFWSQAALVRPPFDTQVLSLFFSVIEDKMFLSILGSLCEAAVFQAFFLHAFHGVTRASVVDTRRCCTKKLTERSDRDWRCRSSDGRGVLFCICVGCVTFHRWDGGGIGRASKMVILGFAFPLETSVVLWTTRIAITACEANRKTKGY